MRDEDLTLEDETMEASSCIWKHQAPHLHLNHVKLEPKARVRMRVARPVARAYRRG